MNPHASAIKTALRSGAVPPSDGLDLLATGLEPLVDAVKLELAEVAKGAGSVKWLRGGYGSGKTFTTRYLCRVAREMGFATSEVQISINDTPLHHLETVYRRLIELLTTAADGPGSFRSVVDGWLYEVGEEVTRLTGLEEDDPAFAGATEERLQLKLAELSDQAAAFAQVLAAFHNAQHAGDFAGAQGLLAWLAGQPNVGRAILARAGVKGSVDGQAALAFLRGLLLLLKQSGYAGLVVVLDEVETIQRMNAQTREKSLNALRQLVDLLMEGRLPGMYLVVTGTPDFFESHKGLRGLPPLYQRVEGRFDPRFPNYRQPQVHLLPFDRDRLLAVARKVRALYEPSLEGRVDDAFLEKLVTALTTRFGGEVALVPRLFLKELVPTLDTAEQHPTYDPHQHHELTLDEASLQPEELAAARAAEEAPKPARRARLDD